MTRPGSRRSDAPQDAGVLLKGYRPEITEPACNPRFRSVHCIAHLDEDIGEVLPYLNALLGGDTYIREPPSVTFRMHGRLVTVRSRTIAVNALRDEAEARAVLDWLMERINEAWRDRDSIPPKYDGAKRPHPLTVYRLLPGTNCRACGQPSCMAFAVLATEGAKDADGCPALDDDSRARLREYLGPFRLG